MKQVILGCIFSLISLSAFSVYKFTPEQGSVEFKTKGWPSLIVIKGESKGVEGQLEEKEGKISGELAFHLETLKTGISLRDDHMKNNYLEVKKYPTAKLTLTEQPVPTGQEGEMKFKGTMELHGVQKEVEGVAQLKKLGAQGVEIDANIPLKLSDFKIAIPNYQGITVAEKVNVHFKSKVAIN